MLQRTAHPALAPGMLLPEILFGLAFRPGEALAAGRCLKFYLQIVDFAHRPEWRLPALHRAETLRRPVMYMQGNCINQMNRVS